MASKTLEQFIKALPKLAPETAKKAIRSWNQETIAAMDVSKGLAPEAGGGLVNSAFTKKAKIAPTGIESYIVYTAPYAQRLHNDSTLRLKKKGEVSYYLWGNGHEGKKKGVRRGQKVNKQRQGRAGFLSKGVDKSSGNFIDALMDDIGDVWLQL
jgi:hypothetical protein